MTMNDESVLNMYMKEINRIQLLSHEEEVELAKKAQLGDKDAKDKIVRANLRFVINIAKKYQHRGIDLVDLIGEGNIGLLIAVDRFDVSKGYHFISYAVWWIRQSILKALCEKSRPIRLPLNRANEVVQIEKARKTLAKYRLSEPREMEEIGHMLDMKPEHIRELLMISNEMTSLDAPVPGSGHNSPVVTYGELVEDDRYVPETYAFNEVMKDDIDDALSTLKPTEEKVLRLRYGLGGYKPMSLKEVGDECKLTKERIRQIEKCAIGRMRNPYRTQKLSSYVA